MRRLVVFVCLGNICRSPMAEFVMKDVLQKANIDYEVLSAGTSFVHQGEDMHQQTKATLLAKKIPIEPFQSKPITEQMCQEASHIIALDESNLQYLLQRFGAYQDKITLFTDYFSTPYKGVPDPWYTRNFEETYELVLQGALVLVKVLKKL